MQKYDKTEVYEETLKYFNGDDLATQVWIDKYCLKDKDGNLLEKTPNNMHKRLAREFARIERKYPNPIPEDEIYELLKDFKYIIPQGSPMAGIGNNYQIMSLSNCFYVDHHGDSYNSIMDVDHKLVSVFKRRGGCGVDTSGLRPKESKVRNAALTSTGSVSFAERYSNTAREVGAEGRRAALMISQSVKHPDIENFIDSKLEQGKITGANISVKITDEFMDAVKCNKDFIQTFPIDLDINVHTGFIDSLYNNEIEYNKLYSLEYSDGSYNRCYAKRINANKLWKKLMKNAHSSAEPGVLFWDTFKRESPSDSYNGFELGGVNPCSELSLSDSESCRLIAVNLYNYVKNPFTNKSYFNFKLFNDHIIKAQRLLDDLVDLELEKVNNIIAKIKSDPELDSIKQKEIDLWEEINRKAKLGRRTGLGITAEGDMLAALGYRYGSKEATNFSERVHKEMALNSYTSSIIMARERGSFPIWNLEKESKNPFINRVIYGLNEGWNPEAGQENPIIWEYEKYGRRNIANLTIAPTGSLSLLTQTTNGIEPAFMITYKRRKKTNDKSKATFIDEVGDMWTEHRVFHHKFKDWFKINKKGLVGIDSYELEDLTDKELKELIKQSPYYKATSSDVDYIGKVEMQGKVQKWVDHSISVTVNMPEDVSVKTVEDVYNKAYEVGCKGVTVYREGSRSGVMVSDTESKSENDIEYHDSIKRPKELKCDIYNKTALKQEWTVLVGKTESGKPFEIFAFKQLENNEFPRDIKHGKIIRDKKKHYRLVGERNGKTYQVENILNHLSEDEKTETRRYSLQLRHGVKPDYIVENINKYASIVSFDKVIARVLSNYLVNSHQKEACPECGGELQNIEGCKTCMNCTYSKCS